MELLRELAFVFSDLATLVLQSANDNFIVKFPILDGIYNIIYKRLLLKSYGKVFQKKAHMHEIFNR